MAYRSSTISGGGTTATPAYAVPAGAATDDIALVGMFTQDGGAITPPAGFTPKYDSGIVNAYRLVVFWKRLTGADSGSYTFTMAGSSYCEGTCVLFSGRVTTGDPFTATDATTGSPLTAITVNAITAAANDDLVGFAHQFNGGAWTPPGGMTERQDAGASSTLDTADAVTAGSTGNMTFTCGGGASGMKAFLGALTALAATVDGETHAPWLLRPPGRISPAGRATPWLGTDDVTSGTAFTVPADDDAGVSDTVALALAFGVAQADTENLTDTIVVDRGNVANDTEALTDTTAFARGTVADDNTGLTDTATVSFVKDQTTTDTTGLTDTTTLESGKGITAAETAGLVDSTTVDRGMASTDPTGITDTVALNLGRTTTDALGLTDTVTVENGKLVTTTDTTGVTDALTLDRAQTSTDPAGLTDTVNLSLARATTDSAGLTDATVVENGKTTVAADTTGLTDSVVLQRFQAIVEQTGLADLVALTRGTVTADTSGLTDTVTVDLSVAHTRTATDTLALSDTVVVLLVPPIVDALILTVRNAPEAHTVSNAPAAHTIRDAPPAHTVRNA